LRAQRANNANPESNVTQHPFQTSLGFRARRLALLSGSPE
jgi:hypothetical protein